MAKIISGYAYTTSRDKEGMQLHSAAAFNPGFDTPILKDHPTRNGGAPKIVGHLLGKKHDAKGLLVDVLVFDDDMADKVKGFSIGTTRKAYATKATGMALDELSLCVEDDPNNPDCTISKRSNADAFEVKLALFGRSIENYHKLQARAVAALKSLVDLAAQDSMEGRS
jgi:hypothetical protein